jgi:RND superfamily putative drug exporter
MKAIANFAVRRRWLVVIGWIVLIFAAQGVAHAMGGSAYKDTYSLPNTETATVASLLKEAGLSNQNGVAGTVVIKNTDNAALTSEPAGLEPALQKLCTSGNYVALISSPWGSINCAEPAASAAGNPELLNSGHGSDTALVVIQWADNHFEPTDFQNVYDSLKTLRTSALEVEFTGNAFSSVGQSAGSGSSVLIGFLAALIILALVFRTVAATVLPLASAAVALITGLGFIFMLSHAINVSNITPYLAELMVIGVGVDYALFITRHRRNLRQGVPVADSIAIAISTSGRAVLFAGTIVCIAILGLIALGVSFFNGMAVATALAVALTMAASLTLLPALLSLFGLKVLPRKQRAAVRAGKFIDGLPTGFWARWSKFVARRKFIVALVSGAIMIALAVPFFSLQLGASDQSSDPKGSTTRTGYDLIASEFGVGYNSTLEAVVSGPGAAQPAYLKRVAQTLAVTSGVDKTSIGAVPLTKSLAFVSFKTTTSPQDEQTYQLVRDLRSTVLPPLYNGTANHVYLSGDTAINVDFAAVLSRKMPLFIAVVVGLAFLLLLVAFRSLVIPLTAAVMNLLAAGGSFGLSVMIFQWGWFSDGLGAGPGGPIDAWVPVMLFAILFGLSMDYQVFLVSRMHEEWVRTKDNREAVTVGQGETGGIITAAALIMIAVFLGFLLTPGRPIKIFGAGLASAVFLDAFILRTALVPSLMHIFGRPNWYFPRWLDRIMPRFSVEAPEALEAQEEPASPTYT